ncbi:MAG: Gfo/Idh/MocA family oxidoreductase [Planctomycetota bacterium]
MQPTKIAVVGAGKLGGYHANLAAKLEEFDLVAVADPFEASRAALAEKVGTRAVADVGEVIGEIDAAVVATPTATHASVVERLLDAGKHVLVEKPIAPTAAEANRMVAAAERSGVTLQVGHVERFSPALVAAGDTLQQPRFIQAVRTSGYTFRSTDIGAVLDLMIHDIDLVLSLAGSEVTEVTAVGSSVLGGHEDVVNTRLTFVNGCVADLTASRVSYQLQRTMNVFTTTGFTALDFATGKATTVTPTDAVLSGTFDGESLPPERKAELFAGKMFEEVLVKAEHEAPAVNAIELELLDFAEAIQTGNPPRVTGEAGRDAVAVAERILDAITQSNVTSVKQAA